MKQVKVKIETSVETLLGDKSVNEILKDICDLCHSGLMYSTSKYEECEKIFYEDKKYEEVYPKMKDRVSVLEGSLCQILDLLED